MSWYIDQESQNRTEFESYASTPKVSRFWLKPGTTREIVFLDDTRFGVHEHKIKVSDKWESYTCSGEGCVLCAHRTPKSYQEMYSILDLTPYLDKSGKEVKMTRRLLAVGKQVADILSKRREDLGGSLFGKKFKVSRLGEKSASCGNDWSNVPIKTPLELAKLPDYLQPLNFLELLKPLSKKEMLEIVMPHQRFGPPDPDPCFPEADLPF